MKQEKLYAERDIMSDEIGPHYAAHISAMTAEGLHKKSDIAAELTYRDAEIEKLRANQPCDLGVGCDEVGICYAEAHGTPEKCGRTCHQKETDD